MSSMGKDITPKRVVDEVLTKWPNLNLFSIYTSVYVPSNGYSWTANIRADNMTDPGDII